MVINLTFSIFERFSCAILIYKNRMAVNGVNVFIDFFLLHILMLSKDFFFPRLRKISWFFVSNSTNTDGIFSTNARW